MVLRLESPIDSSEEQILQSCKSQSRSSLSKVAHERLQCLKEDSESKIKDCLSKVLDKKKCVEVEKLNKCLAWQIEAVEELMKFSQTFCNDEVMSESFRELEMTHFLIDRKCKSLKLQLEDNRMFLELDRLYAHLILQMGRKLKVDPNQAEMFNTDHLQLNDFGRRKDSQGNENLIAQPWGVTFDCAKKLSNRFLDILKCYIKNQRDLILIADNPQFFRQRRRKLLCRLKIFENILLEFLQTSPVSLKEKNFQRILELEKMVHQAQEGNGRWLQHLFENPEDEKSIYLVAFKCWIENVPQMYNHPKVKAFILDLEEFPGFFISSKIICGLLKKNDIEVDFATEMRSQFSQMYAIESQYYLDKKELERLSAENVKIFIDPQDDQMWQKMKESIEKIKEYSRLCKGL